VALVSRVCTYVLVSWPKWLTLDLLRALVPPHASGIAIVWLCVWSARPAGELLHVGLLLVITRVRFVSGTPALHREG
jgi:hypothetical protein